MTRNYVGFSTRKFTLYDNLSFRNRQGSFGIEPFIIYESWILGNTPTIFPSRRTADSIIEQINREMPSYTPVILDIENWDVYTENVHRDNLLTVMQWFKEAFGNRFLGNYAIAPERNMSAALAGSGTVRANWLQRNTAVSPIADQSIALFPSLYTLTASQHQWEIFATETIAEARKYSGSKPVIPFLWPMYHNGFTSHARTFIDRDFWKHQLLTCRRLADGVVLWHNWRFPRQDWDINLPFVKVTQDFIEEHGN